MYHMGLCRSVTAEIRCPGKVVRDISPRPRDETLSVYVECFVKIRAIHPETPPGRIFPFLVGLTLL